MEKEIKEKIIKEFYNRFVDMPTSSLWFLDVERFIKKALTQQEKEIKEKIKKIIGKADVLNWRADRIDKAFMELKKISNN